MKLRQLLIQFEIDHNLSHEEMIERIGVGRSTYFRWLSGESTHLKTSTLHKLSQVLGQDVKELLETEERKKPILGVVKAGYDLWAEQDIEGYIEIGNDDAQKGDYFLRVTGDSMEGSHIYEGDLVYVQQCSTVDSGSIAIVMVDDEVTLKKVHYKNDLMILEATNPKYDIKIFTKEEIESIPVRVIGLVRFVRTDFV